VPPKEGVNIDWAHVGDEGRPNRQAAAKAARDMVAAYGIVYRPSLHTRHSEGRAVDMTITGVIGKKIQNASVDMVLVTELTDLYRLGRSYGVVKLVSDPPHWSDDGH
jgi:D-alanyl-D-alanine dipeptidase